MLAVLAPKISYLHSLEIKRLLIELSEKVKKKEKWNLKDSWKAISNVLLEPVSFFR
jgi:hypothetical protein